MSDSESTPLCVDLDGTLIKLDTLHQALFLLLRRSPSSLFRLPGWLLRGRAYLKEQVLRRVELDVAALPYHQPFLEWLKREHARGRRLVLATAANIRTAQAVAEHLGIFDEVLASDAETNLRREAKLEAVRARFPVFGYAGNDVADFPLWEAAEEIILVNPSAAARKKFTLAAAHIFLDRPQCTNCFLKALRPQQWLKNLLIFAPVLLAHRFTELTALVQAGLAFAAFSLAASSIYILNDLFDLSADQHHPRKRSRPFASGALPISRGAVLIPQLATLSLLLCLQLPPAFLAVLLAYFVLTTAYSWCIKQIPVADVLMLAVLYSMRIVAGSVATGTPASGWFVQFAIFLFLSLALLKRTAELREIRAESAGSGESTQRERGYGIGDLPLLLAFGAVSGYIAVFVFMMYLGSDKVVQLYSRPPFLWALCPLLLYWITRMWHLAWRGKMHDDPLAFAARDPQTYTVAALGVAAMLYAI